MKFFVGLVLAVVAAFPKPIPPSSKGLAHGYHLTPHGCVAGPQPEPTLTPLGDPKADVTRYAHDPLPLSIALYRAHQIHAAKTLWRNLLQQAAIPPDTGTAAALRGQYQSALIALAQSQPNYNSISFDDTGASYNLQRGLNAAAQGRIPAAKTFLGYSLECSPAFAVPQLALGIIAAMQGDLTTARHEWLAALRGYAPSPTASLDQPHTDAIRLLLRYD